MNKFWENKKILVTGGAGFLGKHLINKLIKKGVKKENIIIPISKEYDLRKMEDCLKAIKGIDIVIHLAAVVGGIGFNRKHPGRSFYDNAAMALNLLDAARLEKVEKFVGIGSVCSYPKFIPIPFKEENLWDGYPEETNAPYGLAKKFMLVQSQAYRAEYGFNSIFLLLVNLYGPGDNFDPNSSHVIPALIKKCVDAIDSGADYIECWGTGKPSREFIYVADAAEGILLATELYNGAEPVNIGAGFEITIKELVGKIVKLTGFNGEIRWDSSKPDGQPRRCLDTSLAKKLFGFEAKTSFDDGLKTAIDWYVKTGKTHDKRL
jgi:GDP-L-fucose synthase